MPSVSAPPARPAVPSDLPRVDTPLRFDNRFARLPGSFHARLDPEPLPAPYVIGVSPEVAGLLGLDPGAVRHEPLRSVLAGSALPVGAEPLASVYAGHQFGVWAGRLGDGRALLLGEVTGPDGVSREVQLKGSGRTPWSRGADGRAVLRSSIREFLCSEAMAALGIPTTRALAVVGSDAPVLRETVETAAVVTRVAPSFVRFGHFEYFAHFGRHDALRQLTEWVVTRWFPEIDGAGGTESERACRLLAEVAARTGRLIAAWQSVGFCHGVMNTDNMSILGLTIDYGPFGFLDGFDANHVCNHSDHSGRYAYAAQPGIGQWNCAALAEALLPLIGDVDAAREALSGYHHAFAIAFDERMRAKLGLGAPRPGDDALFDALLHWMHDERVDFTRFFRALCELPAAAPAEPEAAARADAPVRDLAIDRARLDAWLHDWRARLALDAPPGTDADARAAADDARRHAMRAANPAVVLRNHLAEIAIRHARGEDADGRPTGVRDFGEVERLLQVLRRPFDEPVADPRYADAPPAWAGALSVSCSS